MMVVGHGLRPRTVEGPLTPGAPPTSVQVVARRYLCRACTAVIVVLPRGVGRGGRYLVCAIAYALALWGHAGRTASQTRASVSGDKARGLSSPQQWSSLRRWARDAGRIFGAATVVGTLREQAAATARWVASFAPLPTTQLSTDAHAGAAFLPR